MMQVIHRCPHCNHDLPGWLPPLHAVASWSDGEKTTWSGGWYYERREWQRCPVCEGRGLESLGGGISTAPCRLCAIPQ